MKASPTTESVEDSTKSWKAAQPHAQSDEGPAEDYERFDFEFYLKRNIRYHTRRAGLFDQWHKSTAVIGIFFGSAAAATFFGESPGWVPALLSVTIALASALDLVVGTAAKAALHLEFRRRWLSMQQRLETEGLSPELYAARRTIEMDEPAELPVVELQAFNDATLAMLGEDGRDELYDIPWWKRLLGQFFNLGTTDIQQHKSKAKKDDSTQPQRDPLACAE